MYVGPEVLLPVASAVTAIAGFAMMFWRRTVGAVRGTTKAVVRRVTEIFTDR